MIDAQGIVDRITELESALSAARAEVERLRFEVERISGLHARATGEVGRLRSALCGVLPLAQAHVSRLYGPDAPLCQHGADVDVCTCDNEALLKSTVERAESILAGRGPDGKKVEP